jgi:hypothetical protein
MTDWSVWATGIGLATGFVGIVLAVVFFVLGKRERLLRYETMSYHLVTKRLGAIDGLSVAYRGTVVSSLSVTKIAIWNGGREAIRGTDISTTDKLHLRTSDKRELYHCSVTTETSRAIHASALLPNTPGTFYTSCPLAFDHLNHRQGFVVEVIHSFDRDTTIEIVGEVIGGKIVGPKMARDFGGRISDKLTLVTFSVVTAFFSLLFSVNINLGRSDTVADYVVMSASMAIYATVVLVLLYTFIRMRLGIPKILRSELLSDVTRRE